MATFWKARGYWTFLFLLSAVNDPVMPIPCHAVLGGLYGTRPRMLVG